MAKTLFATSKSGIHKHPVEVFVLKVVSIPSGMEPFEDFPGHYLN